jgi:hypothetical protein
MKNVLFVGRLVEKAGNKEEKRHVKGIDGQKDLILVADDHKDDADRFKDIHLSAIHWKNPLRFPFAVPHRPESEHP